MTWRFVYTLRQESCPRGHGIKKRAAGTKSRALQQEIRSLHCCPPPGPELFSSFWGRGGLWFGSGALCNAGGPEIRTYGSSVCFSYTHIYIYLHTYACKASISVRLPSMEDELQLASACRWLAHCRRGSPAKWKQSCKPEVISGIWPCCKLAIHFRLTERTAE